MNQNQFGQIIATTDDLFDLLYRSPELDLSKFAVSDPEKFNDSIRQLHYSTAKLNKFAETATTVDEFDQRLQKNWYMPESYENFDIRNWLYTQCKTNKEKERVDYELVLYESRNLIMLLCYLKYLVDTLRTHKVVWGVGRGSSVASYVLYLIGVHRIDSLKFDLDIHEFLK